MYEAYWGLKEKPFENTPNPKFLYQSAQHEEALARLVYVVEGRKGAAVLTGVFGCGKTLIARSLLARLPDNRYRTVYVANPLLSGIELLHTIAHALHVPNLPDRRSEVLTNLLLESIEQALRENARDGKDTVVIIDEAHVIHEEPVIEQLRLLLNFQQEDRFLLTLILMGQPELKELIDRHKPLAQRMAMGYHLGAFSLKETADYIHHRLAVAGALQPQAIFSQKAVELIFPYSGGIPRRINQLCDLAMVAGMGKGVKQIDEAVLQDAASSLGV